MTEMTRSHVLEFNGVTVKYGPLSAVSDLDLEMPAGTLTLLLGANGAGKSSLLSAAVGLIRPAAGTIGLYGTPVEKMPSHRRARMGMAHLPEGRGVFPSLTVEKNITVGARTRNQAREAVDSTLELFPNLADRRRQLAGSLSGGEQQMLALARCLATQPRVLLLDELSLGLAPKVVRGLLEKVAQLRDEGRTILLVEQFAHAALPIADYAGIMVRGRLTRFGAASELLRLSADELASAYFDAIPQPNSEADEASVA
jgi:branched-chain amino acid transport system ATP-binding protein